ncbi:MAG TPA: TIR domain-containing protein, partial [Blastocatellia bacterium]|nr:TIR domain-containing protein [Blastocatellia bacterium]
MADDFKYDVFLSHSSKDKATVRPLAERLRADGLRVWFDEWEIKRGDNKQTKIKAGLEQSRVLVLCMSANTFGSEWAKLESYTPRFRDPLNTERHFIPLRLETVSLPMTMVQFSCLSWLPDDREQDYARLLEACLLPSKVLPAEAKGLGAPFLDKPIHLNDNTTIWSYAFGLDGKCVLTGLSKGAIELWDIETGRCLRVLEGQTETVYTVAWSADQRRALSGSWDRTIRLWDVETGQCLRVLEGHTNTVRTVAWSADQRRALSGSWDRTIRLWDVETGQCLRVL